MTCIYIHLPYCKSKCIYCDFVVATKITPQKRESYIEALLTEISYYFSHAKFIEPVQTIYFGGGTPALFSADEIGQILKTIRQFCVISCLAEITLEANPDSIESTFSAYRSIGINRLSIGVQSLQANELKRLSRIHSPEKAIAFVQEAEKNGFHNISIDLMYGIPEQTQTSWEDTLNIVSKLPIQHISMYGLKVEEQTKLAQVLKQGRMVLPPDDDTVDWYEQAIQLLDIHGFFQYELSNFSKTGKVSRHNINYWQNNPFWGFGVGAHGYINGTRYENTADLKTYLAIPTEHVIEHYCSQQEQLENMLIFGLRQTQGVSLVALEQSYGVGVSLKITKHLQQYLSMGLLKLENEQLALTPAAYSVSNEIFQACLDLPFAIDS